MTRTPDKYIAAALAKSTHEFVSVFSVYALAAELQAAEENPPRVKCDTCTGMFVKPTPCLAINCGFKENRE